MSAKQIVDLHEQVESASTLDELLGQLGLIYKASPSSVFLETTFLWLTRIFAVIILISCCVAIVIGVLPWWTVGLWFRIIIAVTFPSFVISGTFMTLFDSSVPLLTEAQKKEKIITWCQELIEEHREQLLGENTAYFKARAKLEAKIEKATSLVDRFEAQISQTTDPRLVAELDVGLREAQAEQERLESANSVNNQRKERILEFFRYLDKMVGQIDSSLAHQVLFQELAELKEEGGEAIVVMDKAIIDLVFSFQEEADKLGVIFEGLQLHSGATLTAELATRPIALLVDETSEPKEASVSDELDSFLDNAIESVRARVEVA